MHWSLPCVVVGEVRRWATVVELRRWSVVIVSVVAVQAGGGIGPDGGSCGRWCWTIFLFVAKIITNYIRDKFFFSFYVLTRTLSCF